MELGFEERSGFVNLFSFKVSFYLGFNNLKFFRVWNNFRGLIILNELGFTNLSPLQILGSNNLSPWQMNYPDSVEVKMSKWRCCSGPVTARISDLKNYLSFSNLIFKHFEPRIRFEKKENLTDNGFSHCDEASNIRLN